MKKNLTTYLLLVFLIFTLVGCSNAKNNETSENLKTKYNIVTTIFPCYDFAKSVVGDQMSVRMLIKPGAEVHSFDPSPTDIISLQEADVIIYIGGESESWMESILNSVDLSKKTVIKLMDVVPSLNEEKIEGMENDEENHGEESHEQEEHGEHGSEYDEHIWTSPSNAKRMVEAIKKGLSQLDQEHAGIYETNAASYMEEIQSVDDKFKEVIKQTNSPIMVFGDRFPFLYFAKQYGIEYRAAFAGCSTEMEASAGTLAYLINYVKEHSIHSIFTVEFSNQNIARAISEQTGAEILQFHSCHNVTKDEWEKGETYVSLMNQNVETLKKAFLN